MTKANQLAEFVVVAVAKLDHLQVSDLTRLLGKLAYPG